MRLFQFVKWWRHQADPFDRICVGLVLWAIPCIISGYWIGPESAIAAVASYPIIIYTAWMICGLYRRITALLQKFNEEVPTDDVRIINKLKYGNGSSKSDEGGMYP